MLSVAICDWKWIKSSRKIEAVLHTLNPCQSATFYGFFRGFKRFQKKLTVFYAFCLAKNVVLLSVSKGWKTVLYLKTLEQCRWGSD